LRLTACGEALRDPAQSILQQVTMAENSLANLREGVRGRLRIGVIPTILPYWIAPRIVDFQKAFPEVDLQTGGGLDASTGRTIAIRRS